MEKEGAFFRPYAKRVFPRPDNYRGVFLMKIGWRKTTWKVEYATKKQFARKT
jgi:hypothetical protein